MTDTPELKRVLSPHLLLLFILGDILGTGIYALTGTIARQVGERYSSRSSLPSWSRS